MMMLVLMVPRRVDRLELVEGQVALAALVGCLELLHSKRFSSITLRRSSATLLAIVFARLLPSQELFQRQLAISSRV